MIIISLILLGANSHYKWLMPMECLLIAAVLCSTDTVAVLTLITEDKYKVLNSVLFGEGVVNDAVAILLFRAMSNLMQGSSGKVTKLSWGEFGIVGLEFIWLASISLILGITVGLMTAYILKKVDLDEEPTKQCLTILLAAYVSYLVSESLNFSGIITLFSCGFTLAHYAMLNINKSAQEGSVVTVEVFN